MQRLRFTLALGAFAVAGHIAACSSDDATSVGDDQATRDAATSAADDFTLCNGGRRYWCCHQDGRVAMPPACVDDHGVCSAELYLDSERCEARDDCGRGAFCDGGRDANDAETDADTDG